MLFHVDIAASSILQTILSSVQNAMRAYTWALVDQASNMLNHIGKAQCHELQKKEETGQIPSTSFINGFIFPKKDPVFPTALLQNRSPLSPLISHTRMPQMSPNQVEESPQSVSPLS